MKIYVAHSRDFDFRNELYEPLQQSDISKVHTFFLPHEGTSEVNSKEIIKNSSLLIAEISHPSTGVGIELGWANAFDLPILAFYRSNAKPSSFVNYVAQKVAVYNDPKDMVELLLLELQKYGT